MAESVDALVSNTSGAIRAGSTPAQGTTKRTPHFKSPLFYFHPLITRWSLKDKLKHFVFVRIVSMFAIVDFYC